MASITDVARAAGVSPATVSRVLNGTRPVSAERVERVRRAVADLGYQPFSPARALRRQSTDVWAVIVADVQNPFFTSVVRGLEDGAREHGFRVVLCNSDEDLSREREYIDVAVKERMAGVVIAVASTRYSRLLPLADANIPVVAIDRETTGAAVDSVLVDNRRGAREATQHLLEAGARRIACITGPARVSTAAERFAGYRAALQAAGQKIVPELVLRKDFRISGGEEAIRQLFRRKRDRPDALFVANNLMTVGALSALHELGVTLPDDVLLVGFDDAPWATLVTPQVTVVAQPTYRIGHTAAELLATARGQADSEPRQVVLAPTLLVRASSGGLR